MDEPPAALSRSFKDALYESDREHVTSTEPPGLEVVRCMVLTFYVGEAAAAFKQYAVYVQRRTATHLAQFAAVSAG